jgi:putative radical SAM enzyme (TIGR03279 family)
VLLQVNGHSVRDVLDVQFYAADEEVELVVRRDRLVRTLRSERAYGVPLGLDFTASTFDGLRRCRNRCDFCFVAQMPPGLRASLYVRDDDYRYSLLYGSYVTLTNLTPEDWARLDEQRLSPLYVSVHATEPEVRRALLGREDTPDILPQLDRLAELGILVHAQVVLIPGVNDGAHLARTIADLAQRYPSVASIGVVPVGVTRYHRGHCRTHTADEVEAAVRTVEAMQTEFRASYGCSLVYLADEWYLVGGVDVPEDAAYDGYPQMENGIGMVRQFLDDASQVSALPLPDGPDRITLACGLLTAPLMRRVARGLATHSGVRIEVIGVPNHTFGPTVTVSGLLTGGDVLTATQGRELGDAVFLPAAMFSATGSLADKGPVRTLDDLTLRDLAERLGRPVLAAGWMSEVWERLREGTWRDL